MSSNIYDRLLSVMRGWPPWFWLGLLLVVAVTAWGATFVFNDPDARNSLSERIQALATMLTAGAGAIAWLWTRARPAARLPLERAVDELAKQLREQWARAAAERGLITRRQFPYAGDGHAGR